MTPDKSKWDKAPSPNYSNTNNLKYPYSDFPYTELYQTVPLDRECKKTLIVDYWGEGRIVTKDGLITGFKDAYNVNHQYKLVSNGPDIYKRIPNRIPVKDYDSLNTKNYIEDGFADFVTIMGSPATDNCSNDIARIVNKNNGVVILYDITGDDLKWLTESLKKISFYPILSHDVPPPFNEIVLHEGFTVRSFYPENIFIKKAADIIKKDRNEGAEILRQINKLNNDVLLNNVINQSINTFSSGLIECAHVLYLSKDEDDIKLFKRLPVPIQSLFNGANLKIINYNYSVNAVLKSTKNSSSDIRVYGGKYENSDRFKWQFSVENKPDATLFFILNFHSTSSTDKYRLYLEIAQDKDGDREAWVRVINEENAAKNKRFKWKIECAKANDNIIFKFYNSEFSGQFLKVIESADAYGDRKAMGSSFTDNQNHLRDIWTLSPL
ncbi:hypothetical protein [Proteus mirabilis]|uniref:hypothetical protein n=1 Tax=Proteus mirabilis TaxID=584 RepID=UPI000F882B07|nr:hypothetical protein [Proteus mirabilis]RUL12391.1 hypothetical protein ELP66_04225 [Proteus mirabilis]